MGTPTLKRWPLPITLLPRATDSGSMAMAIFMASALLPLMLITVMEVWAMATGMATSMASAPLMPMPTTADTTAIQPTLLAMSTMASAPLMPMPTTMEVWAMAAAMATSMASAPLMPMPTTADTTAIQPTLLAMPTTAEKLHH